MFHFTNLLCKQLCKENFVNVCLKKGNIIKIGSFWGKIGKMSIKIEKNLLRGKLLENVRKNCLKKINFEAKV